jgi:hypothetical protein
MPRLSAAITLSKRLRGRRLRLLGLAMAALLFAAPARAITLQFDYSYDGAGFFGTDATPTPARHALEFAGRAFDAFYDSLVPIQPADANSWTARFRNPGAGDQASINNLTVPADTIIVFAGARNLSGAKLAEGGRGSHTFPIGSNPTTQFVDAVTNRGQGVSDVDFAPWGGFIEFDTTSSSGAARPWHYDLESPPPSDAFDFYTVAVHELAHLLGFGTSTAFLADVSNGQFIGATATELYGQAVPLHADNQHWAVTVESPPFAEGTQPRPSLAPSLTAGERRLFAPLDYAAMADIGWLATPELLRLPGDVDGDADADGSDFLAWQRNLGGSGGSLGDVNGDLIVDDYDGWLVRQNFGAVGGPSNPFAHPAATVPEPAAALLLAIGVLMQRVSRLVRWRMHPAIARRP